MTRCECGSYAINPGRVGRDDSDPHLCDVCYWRARAQRKPDAETIVLIKACRAAFSEELAAYDIATQAERLRCICKVSEVTCAFGEAGNVMLAAIVAKIGAKE